MVVDREDSCVHIFSEDGVHLNKFKLQGHYDFPYIAFHRLTEHVVIAGEATNARHVEIFTKDGEFVRSTQIHEKRIYSIEGMTVTKDGRIAVTRLLDIDFKWKVLVI